MLAQVALSFVATSGSPTLEERFRFVEDSAPMQIVSADSGGAEPVITFDSLPRDEFASAELQATRVIDDLVARYKTNPVELLAALQQRIEENQLFVEKWLSHRQ